jgi:threonine/homoserine/homoserine lactone efflux protein
VADTLGGHAPPVASLPKGTPVVVDALPLALGIALSPFPIIPAILLLLTPRAAANAWSFLAAWVVGILAATTVFTLLTDVIEKQETSPVWVSWVRVVGGVALVVYGLLQWRSRNDNSDLPGWMASIERATPTSALRVGLLLSAANPKVVLIAAAGGLAIGAGSTSAWAEVATVLAFTAIAASTVAIPVVLYTLLGDRVLRPLTRAKDWLTTHNSAVMGLVLVVLGLLLLSKGVGDLRAS